MLLLSEPVLAPTGSCNTSPDAFEQIVLDIIDDYAIYTTLLSDIYSLNQYRISIHANSPDSATAFLSQGFDKFLASAITAYYLQWLPELSKMAVIPTDSIPVITEQDIPYLTMQQISPDMVVLERIYTNCYEIGDKYLYLITAQQKEGKWIIIDLQLDCL
jgi:hypothetical protein